MLLSKPPKAVEYALKALICLTLSEGKRVSACDVARLVGIPTSQAAKTLHFLNWAGITRSRRGSKGGYELERAPEEIRLGQVLKLFQPVGDELAKSIADPLLRIWLDTSSECERNWEQLTISELARRTAGQWNYGT
jgi:Rrf2 family protein